MYDYSYIGVVDGTNGELLWSLNCSMGAMSSAVTVKSKIKGQDGMLFFASGCETKSVITMKKRNTENALNVAKGHFCPSDHWGIEQSMCVATEKRDKRHNGDDDDDDESMDSNDSHGPEVLRPAGIDFPKFADDVPTNIWESEDETDQFPDPWSDTRSFVQDYCEIPYDTMVNEVYFLTPNMIKSGLIKPIIINSPYVHSK